MEVVWRIKKPFQTEPIMGEYTRIVTCRSDCRRVLNWMIGFIDTLNFQLGTTGNSALSLFYTLSVHCYTRIRVVGLH
jgi:hypothetical protein